MNILHLSDIHFGRDNYNISEPFSKKNEILDSLIDYVSELDSKMKPDLVLVTGDIAWYGKASEYEEAYKWFKKLMEKLELDGNQIVFCPGNHDVNRSVAVNFHEKELLVGTERPKLSIKKCDEYYQYENAHLLEARFHNYNIFCERIGMQPYSYKLHNGEIEYSYLVGNSEFSFGERKYSISCFNTAYLPYGEVLKDDQMFLGLPQIQRLCEEGKLQTRDSEVCDEIYRIALFHHADRFLHPNEQCEYDNREASLSVLLQSVDLALCGHTETGGLPVVRSYENGGSLLTGGATYYNDEHPNSFSLINITDTKNMEKCSFYYNGNEWKPFYKIDKFNWKREKGFLIWKDDINNYPLLSYGVQIDGILKVFYHGRFKITNTKKKGQNLLEISNCINPARDINICSTSRIMENGELEQGIELSHSESEFQSITSKKILAEYNQFIADHITGAKVVVAGLLDNAISWKYAQQWDVLDLQRMFIGKESNYEWFKMLRDLEEYYDVRFKHPFPNSELKQCEKDTVQLLYEMKKHGDIIINTDNIDEAFYIVHNEEEMLWTKNMADTNETINFHFTRHMMIRLFGVEIKLGECDIYLKGFKIKDSNDVEYKFNTWKKGDVRRIDVIGTDKSEWYMIPKKNINEKNIKNIPEKFIISFPMEAPVIVYEPLSEHIVEVMK